MFSSVSIAPYGDAVPEAEGRAGWGRDMPALSYAERSGSAAGRAADRALQPIVRPPSLTHIAQVCGGWTIKNLVNAKLRPGLA